MRRRLHLRGPAPENRAKELAVLAIAALASLAACGDDFDPASLVDSLRVLGVKAEPPELALPSIGAAAGIPDRATLSALVADPAQLVVPGRATSVVYLACTGDPLDPDGGVCTSFEELRDVPALARSTLPTDPAAPFGLGALGAVTFSGLEGCVHGEPCAPPAVGGDPAATLPTPAYVVPPELQLELLPAGVPQRVLGMEAVVLAVAIAASPEELLASGVEGVPGRVADLFEAREHVISVKRISVRGPDLADEPNLNPLLGGLAIDGAPVPTEPTGGPVLARKAEADLSALLPVGGEALKQSYTDYDAFGVPIAPATEEWVYSFFATSGELDRVHTRDTAETNRYTAPRDVPPGGEVAFYLVVRDHRGGTDWLVRRVRVE